jgi:ankyrin repeat protein
VKPGRMHSPAARSVLPIAFLVAAACAGMPGSGQCGEAGAGAAELRATDVVSALEVADTAPLLALLARHPRLPDAILTTDGVGSLAYAAAIGNTPALRILIRAGARLDVQDTLARTALYLAVANTQEAAALQLIAAGASVNLPDQTGASPLHLAAKLGLPSVASGLLSHGAVVDALTARATTPLAVAAYLGHLTVARLLVEAAADTNHADADGVTPLHCAAQSKNPEVVRYLLSRGADRSAKDSLGQTPADWARRAGDRQIEALLGGPPPK